MLKGITDKLHSIDFVHFFVFIIIVINIIVTITAFTYLFRVSYSIATSLLLRGDLFWLLCYKYIGTSKNWIRWSLPSVCWIVLKGYYNSLEREHVSRFIHILFFTMREPYLTNFTFFFFSRQQNSNCWKNLNLFCLYFFLSCIRNSFKINY